MARTTSAVATYPPDSTSSTDRIIAAAIPAGLSSSGTASGKIAARRSAASDSVSCASSWSGPSITLISPYTIITRPPAMSSASVSMWNTRSSSAPPKTRAMAVAVAASTVRIATCRRMPGAAPWVMAR